MKSLFFYSREVGLTNDPRSLFAQFQECKEKMRHGLIWPKGDEDVRRLVSEFFAPEKFLKRLMFVKNRSNSFKHCSLFGFYQQLKKRERLLNLVDWQRVRLGQDEDFKEGLPYK